MFRHISIGLLLLGLPHEVLADRVPLLAFSQGARPNDTAFENKSTLVLENNDTLGRKVLKIKFAAGDSFGMSRGRLRDWRAFDSLEFEVLNPQAKPVAIAITIKHAGSKNFRTRADVSIELKPGKNSARVDLRQLVNNDKSRPDLSSVQHWYVTCPGTAPLLYFGDIWLVSGANAGKPGRGRVVKTDPARMKRIRSAKMPPVTQPVEFHTRQADAILSALEVFPPDNPWNEVVEDWPLHANSSRMIASIGGVDGLEMRRLIVLFDMMVWSSISRGANLTTLVGSGRDAK